MTDVNIQGFALSPQQRRLWTLAREQQGPSPYLAHCTIRMTGALDRTILKSVVSELSARHEIMRTTFYSPAELSSPLQVIPGSDLLIQLDDEDLSALNGDDRQRAVESVRDRIVAAVAGAPDALPRAALLRVAPDSDLLLFAAPALRADMVSLRNLAADVVSEYDARAGSRTRTEATLQYADASVWLNDMLSSPETEAGRRFWDSQDLSACSTTTLACERHGAPERPFAPRRVAIQLADDHRAAALRIAADAGTTLELFALACWQTLLQRHTGRDAILVGYLADGRSFPELGSAIGPLARCLPLGGELPGDIPFADGMRRMADAAAGATGWGECYDGPVPPFVFERIDFRFRSDAHGVAFEIADAHACVEKFRLKLSWQAEGAGGMHWLEYDSAAFEQSDVLRLAAQFEQLFASAAENPSTPVGELGLVPAAQEREILALCATRSRLDTRPELVHRRFEQQASRVPDTVAVRCEDQALTYAQLNERANRLAHYLQTLGVGPDTPVGLCLERSVDIAVGILGIMKAGGAYVPLDPRLPSVRRTTMLQDSGAKVAVTMTTLARDLPSFVTPVLVDGDRPRIDALPGSNPAAATEPHHLAYVLFTSGSTGKPKGVAVEHRQLARYVDAVVARLELPAPAAYATVTTFGADLGHTAIYPALTTGGSLHIVTEERAGDANAFAEYSARHAIDVLKIVPSHLKALLTCSRPASVLPRQRLVLGGEACPRDLVEEVRRLAPQCVIFNHYGPTETTVGCVAYRIPAAGLAPGAATVPIGQPLDHVRAYVLDRQRRLVPFWVPGELYIGGGGVARGYLGDPALTREKFVPDPWAADECQRMYSTGDRVFLRPDGAIEFLGRGDGQLKIRGYRVEIGEVDAALRSHPGLKDVAVLAHDDGTGLRLSAFFVSRNGTRPQAAELKNFLEHQGLPDYAVPTAFVAVDALPVTSNGKLDRERLLDNLARAIVKGGEDEPLSEWESMMAGLWQEYLGVDQVHPHDNFYDLGGHSLLAIQVVTALDRRARVQVSPRDLVFHTLRQFAALCQSKSSGIETSPAGS